MGELAQLPIVKQLPINTELVEVLDSGVIICREAAPSLAEIGSTGMTAYGNIYREEYNVTLRGQTGRQVFQKMRRSDGQVQGLLRLIKTPILAAQWYVSVGENEAAQSRKTQQVAQFVRDNLWKYGTSSFPQVMSEILTMLEFGFSAFEKVWDIQTIDRKQRVVLRKLAQRHAMDAVEFAYDSHGGPLALIMWDHSKNDPRLPIPIEKLLVFSHEREGGDMEGVSVLRPAYKHWFYKENLYKVDAIQKERHGIGIPVIKLPPGYSPDDKTYAQELGRNLRTNENAHVVLPPMWDIFMLKLEGNLTKPMESIEHHDTLMVRAILGQFLNMTSGGGSVDQFMDVFLKSTRFIADQIRDVFNKHLIPELVNYNFTGNFEMPELRVRRLGDTVDWRTMSFAIRNFIGAGALVPDDDLETWIRREMDLPPAVDKGQRLVLDMETPQGGDPSPVEDTSATAGLPRQSDAGNTRKTPGSNGRVGRDGSRQ